MKGQIMFRWQFRIVAVAALLLIESDDRVALGNTKIVQKVENWPALIDLLENGAQDMVFELPGGVIECTDTLEIRNVDNVEIKGQGRDITIVEIRDRLLPDCIRLVRSVSNLTIHDFELTGTFSSDNAILEHNKANNNNIYKSREAWVQGCGELFGPGCETKWVDRCGEIHGQNCSVCDRFVNRGITTSKWICLGGDDEGENDRSEYGEDIHDVTIQNMDIYNLTTAISLQGKVGDKITGSKILGNRIDKIRGTASGLGYGIQTSLTPNLIIKGNKLTRVGRHSIYVGLGGEDESERIVVIGNTIADGGYDKPSSCKQTCIAIARSAFVTVADNIINRCYAMGLSVERDDSTPVRIIPKEIYLWRNEFINSQTHDIWVNLKFNESPYGTVWIDGNHRGNNSATMVGREYGWFVRLDEPVPPDRRAPDVQEESKICGD